MCCVAVFVLHVCILSEVALPFELPGSVFLISLCQLVPSIFMEGEVVRLLPCCLACSRNPCHYILAVLKILSGSINRSEMASFIVTQLFLV